MPDPSRVTREGDRTVIVNRDFDAPRALVWRAFAEPALLTRWLLGPPGWDMHLCEVDARTGGTYTWGWRNVETRDEFGFSGIYSDVQPERLLADTQTFHQGTLAEPMGDPTQNIVTFTDTPAGTQVITRIRYIDAATMDMVLSQGMSDGMEMSYARLDALVPDIA